ncbi:MAG: FAD:protein FMN transferase [Clostridia bacterium]|nr:FAD:protein FMN transferase [Clostridia bacterium]
MIKKDNFNKFLNRKFYFFALLILLICFSFGCSSAGEKPVTKSKLVLNTFATISIYDREKASLANECLKKCEDYELIFSRTNPESELYRLNASGSMEVSDDLLCVIKTGLRYGRLSNGSFDITCGKLSDIYNFSSENPQLPERAEIEEILKHIDYRNIEIEGNKVTLKDPEAEIDLGAIAKGYIADRLKDYLVENDAGSAIINLGGNVMLVGSKPDGSDFLVDLQYPFEDLTKPIGSLRASDESVVTSGIYERYFKQDGKLYHHILNPETGLPFENGLLAVSIVGPESQECDVLSTVVFTLGFEKGMDLINSLDNYRAVFITDDYKLHYSDGFEQFE